MRPGSRSRRLPLAALALALSCTSVLAACGSDSKSAASDTTAAKADAAADAAPPAETGPVTLRLGYFPNVTHAPALVGVEGGIFAKDLGSNVDLKLSTFNAGPAASEAIFANAIDATFIGPNPAINAYAKSGGKEIRIVAGTASGGAFLVVKPAITSAADLKGKKLATPQLGNTQDVALRSWLKSKGLKTDTTGGGDVSVLPQENAQTLDTFKAGQIDGAWVPEPWATRLVNEGGGKILVDEADLWPEGKYVTTHLIVRTEFLKAHPATVEKLIEGLADSIDVITKEPARAKTLVAQGIDKATGKPIAPELVDASFKHITFTLDPIASSLYTSAKNAESLGLLDPVANLKGIYDLTLLNQVLKARGEQPASTT